MLENSACPGCGAGRPIEDVPVCRHSNPIPTCERRQSCGPCGGRHPCGEQLEQILEALSCQNQLLADLLGAVNGLTATLLARRDCP